MKLTFLSPALAAIVGFALASAPLTTHAQTSSTTASTPTATSTPTPAKPKTTRGLVTAVDTTGSTISIQNKTDGTRTFSIASTIKITKNKKPATLADFAVGDKVSISYTTDASGTLTATRLSGRTVTPTSASSSATTSTNSSAPAATTTTSSAPATTTSN